MSYDQYSNSNAVVYTDHDIDPYEKGYDWILSYLRSAWNDSKSFLGNSLYFGAQRYREIRMYGMGKQSIDKYKRIYGIDEQNSETYMTTDFSPVAIAAKYREIAISLIVQKLYDSEISAVDPLSKSEEDKHFAAMQIKMMMRKVAEQMQSQLANSPHLKRQQGEPEDEEELAISKPYSFKHNLAMKMELGCSYAHQINNEEEERVKTASNLVDFGFGGYRDWIDETGLPRYRAVNPENFVTSYCCQSDFSDMTHCGEVIEVMLVDLAPYFDKEQRKLIAKTTCGKHGNQNSVSFNRNDSNYFDNFKVHVWDAVFYSWNSTVYRNEMDKSGNLSVGKTDYQNRRASMKDRTIEFRGKQLPEFMEANRKVVYKGKWIIDTEYMYDWGLMENQKRDKETWWDTTLPYRMQAWNFYKMQFSGITERLIPVIDDWHRTYYKLQDLKNKLIPYIMNINLTAIEMAGFAGKGGGAMPPKEQIDFIFQNYAAVFRETDLLKGGQTGGKAVTIEASGQLTAFAHYYQDMQQIEGRFMTITGLNDVTNGNTPDPRNLTPNIQAAMQSTNNCLYLVGRTEKKLYHRNTEAIIGNIQLAVHMGKVEGYVKALGNDAMQYFEITKEVALRKFGLFVGDAPSQMERQQFAQDLQIKDANGMIEPEDKIIIMDCRNLKQATSLLAYKIRKRKEVAQQMELQKIDANNKGQQQSTMMLEQVKQQTATMLHQFKMEEINLEGQWTYQTELAKKNSDMQEGAQQAQAKVLSSHLQAQAKVESTQIQAATKTA